jgi:hypothetical protein
MDKRLTLIRDAQKHVSGGSVPEFLAEDLSNFIYDGGYLYASRAAEALCRPVISNPDEDVIETIVDSYVLELLGFVNKPNKGYGSLEQRNSLVAFLDQLRAEIEKHPEYSKS